MEVRHPYYLCKCCSCGYTDSSEAFIEVSYGDDADVKRPKCGSVDNDDIGDDQ